MLCFKTQGRSGMLAAIILFGRLQKVRAQCAGTEQSFQSLIEQLAKLCGHVEILLYQESTLHPAAPLDEQFSQFLESDPYHTAYSLSI